MGVRDFNPVVGQGFSNGDVHFADHPLGGELFRRVPKECLHVDATFAKVADENFGGWDVDDPFNPANLLLQDLLNEPEVGVKTHREIENRPSNIFRGLISNRAFEYQKVWNEIADTIKVDYLNRPAIDVDHGSRDAICAYLITGAKRPTSVQKDRTDHIAQDRLQGQRHDNTRNTETAE